MQRALLAVEVVEEHLQRGQPLHQAAFQRAHSAAAITRGTRQTGITFSVPRWSE